MLWFGRKKSSAEPKFSLVFLFGLPNTLGMQNDLTSSQAVKIWLISNNRNHRWLARKLRVSDSTLSKILTGRVAPSEVVQGRLLGLTGVDFGATQRAA